MLMNCYVEYEMYIGINDNVYRDMEWCGMVIEFLFLGKLIFLYVFNVIYYLLVKIFG